MFGNLLSYHLFNITPARYDQKSECFFSSHLYKTPKVRQKTFGDTSKPGKPIFLNRIFKPASKTNGLNRFINQNLFFKIIANPPPGAICIFVDF